MKLYVDREIQTLVESCLHEDLGRQGPEICVKVGYMKL